MVRWVYGFVWSCLDQVWDHVYWFMMAMDVTQWGILSAVFVIAGFMALRTRL